MTLKSPALPGFFFNMSKFTKKIESAKALFNAGDYQRALKEIKTIDGGDTNIIFEKKVLEAAIYVRTERAKEGLDLITAVENKYQKETVGTCNIKGIAYRALKDNRKAIEILQAGLEKYPSSVDLAHNLSVTAADMGNFGLAETAGLQALSINPKYIETFKNLGRVYIAARNTKKALELFQKLNTIDQDSVDVLVGFGAIELLQSRPAIAAPYFEKALAKNDALSAAWANLGICHKYLGNYQESKRCLEMAITKDANQIEHVWNLSLVNLALGNFTEGWKQYEVRYDPTRIAPDAVKLPKTQIPILKPQHSVAKKTIVLVQEQGYGDTLQFFRLSKLLKEEGAKKIIAIVSVEIKEIIRSIPWVDEVRTEMLETREVPDFWTFSMSLPARYRLESPEQIPTFEPYLSIDPVKKGYWDNYLSNIDGNKKYRVGLVWAGRETHSNDANRSIQLSMLEPLLAMHQSIQFVALQKGPREKEAESDQRILSLGSQLKDFSDSAALLANLDLLISVDSSPVHLAGALGMPVWTLVPAFFDFRWLIDQTDSPWYPSMTLFRQRTNESWESVIKKIQNKLRQIIQGDNERWNSKSIIIHPTLQSENMAGCQLFLRSAFQYHVEGRLDLAEQMYKKLLSYEQYSLDGIRNLAALYRSLGKLKLSQEIYENGENKVTGDAIFYTNYANLLLDLGKGMEALSKVEKALKITPNHEAARVTLARCNEYLKIKHK